MLLSNSTVEMLEDKNNTDVVKDMTFCTWIAVVQVHIIIMVCYFANIFYESIIAV